MSALNNYLFAAGLSLKASGSNDGQTIVGALSTGTHGGAYKFGAISEMIVGLHLVVGPNKHVYLERQSYPVVKPSFAQSLGAEFKQDDTLFNAALVSFGSFGIIHGLMIETRELFALNALRFKVPYDATLKGAITTCDPTKIPLPAFAQGVPTDKPYHFELFLNPNEPSPPSSAFIQVMYETAFDPNNYAPPMWDGGESGLGADGLNVMGTLVDNIPSPLDRLIVPLLNKEIEHEFAPYLKKAIIRDLFRGEKTLGRTLACGVGMPANRAVEAMDIAFKRYATNGDDTAGAAVGPLREGHQGAARIPAFRADGRLRDGFRQHGEDARLLRAGVGRPRRRRHPLHAALGQVQCLLDAGPPARPLRQRRRPVDRQPRDAAGEPGGAAGLQQPLHGRSRTGDLRPRPAGATAVTTSYNLISLDGCSCVAAPRRIYQ